MILKICHDSNDKFVDSIVSKLSEIFPELQIEALDESYTDERRKSFKLKAKYGARLTPFAVLEGENVVKMFYSETASCTLDNIINTCQNERIIDNMGSQEDESGSRVE